MAIKDTARKPYIEDNDSNIFIGIDLPIRKSDGIEGYFASTSTTIEAVKNNIRNLLNTEQGERFFQPNLGLNLKTFLYENITDESTAAIENSILDILELWLPFVEVRNIEIKTNPITNDQTVGANTLSIKIIFNIKQDPNTLDSIQITVTENGNDVDTDLDTSSPAVGGGGGSGY